MYILLSLMLTAHAGVFQNLCDSCLSLIVKPDPYYLDDYSTDYLVRSLDALNVAKRWRVLNAHERFSYDRLIKQLDLRRTYGSDDERDLADEALIRSAP